MNKGRCAWLYLDVHEYLIASFALNIQFSALLQVVDNLLSAQCHRIHELIRSDIMPHSEIDAHRSFHQQITGSVKADFILV